MKSKVYSNLFFILFLAIAVVLVERGYKKSKEKRFSYLMNGEYAIGVFSGRAFKSGHVHTIHYDYVVNNKTISMSDSRANQDSDRASDAYNLGPNKAKDGDQFLVLYKAADPQRSIIRLDYPIKDSTDFKRYIKVIEELRKKELNK